MASLVLVGDIAISMRSHLPMIYRGHVKQGIVVFDHPTPLADGTAVQVQPLPGDLGENNRSMRGGRSPDFIRRRLDRRCGVALRLAIGHQ